jgi:MFS family permease
MEKIYLLQIKFIYRSQYLSVADRFIFFWVHSAICIILRTHYFFDRVEVEEAKPKDYRFIFSVYYSVIVIASPLIGIYLNRIGAKVVFNIGIFTVSVATIVFYLLGGIGGRSFFIGMAHFIFAVDALGYAAHRTASLAIISQEFPDNVATTFAMLNISNMLGIYAGPFIRDLQQNIGYIGVYFSPFPIMGLVLFIIAVITVFILPAQVNLDSETRQQSMWSVLKNPRVSVVAFIIAASNVSITTLTPTLHSHLW